MRKYNLSIEIVSDDKTQQHSVVCRLFGVVNVVEHKIYPSDPDVAKFVARFVSQILSEHSGEPVKE